MAGPWLNEEVYEEQEEDFNEKLIHERNKLSIGLK